MGSEPEVEEALAAERATLSREVRLVAAALDAYLHPDFLEFGASGGELRRTGTGHRVAAAAREDPRPITWTDMHGVRLAEGVVLVRYVAVVGDRRSNRSSIWQRGADGRWLMLHHQGTPVPAGAS